MLSYTPDLRDALIKKSLLPNGPSLAKISKESGVPVSTIHGWKQRRTMSSMGKSNKWISEKKLEAIIKTSSMNESELGEYLRKNGLHSAEIEEWKKECLSGFKSPGRPRLDPELALLRKKSEHLEKDLKRKDRALAEMAARIVLIKKTQLLFGESVEEE
jgi:hypothetical protein